MPLADAIDQLISRTAPTLVTRSFQRAWDAAAPVDEYPLAQIIERLDSRVCPLCRALHGRIIRRDDPQFARWRLGSHINCRRVMAWIHRSETDHTGQPTQPTFPAGSDVLHTDAKGRSFTLDQLTEKHGHFVRDPQKYAALRTPVRPTGRDFIAYRKPLPGGGLAPHVTLRFRDGMPKWAVRQTLQSMGQGFTDLYGLPIPGDRELAVQMLWHAGRSGLFSNLSAIARIRSGAWPAAALTPEDLALVPSLLLSDPETHFVTSQTGSRTEWVLHNPSITLPDGRVVEDPSAFYSPAAGEFTDIARLPS